MSNKINNRIIYYYQTLIGLKDIINSNIVPTHIILSAFHFGIDSSNNPYIHLNNYKPDNKMYNSVWNELEILSKRGVKIMIMLGGAGGAYTSMFSNYECYYDKLYKFLQSKPFIQGIDLDIEEEVSLDNVKKLIKRIDTDFNKDFIITMAPIGGALTSDYPGLGGFYIKNYIKQKKVKE